MTNWLWLDVGRNMYLPITTQLYAHYCVFNLEYLHFYYCRQCSWDVVVIPPFRQVELVKVVCPGAAFPYK